MVYLFTLLFFLAIILLVVGLIKPKAVIRWGDPENASRLKVFLIYGLGSLVLLVFVGITAPEPTPEVRASSVQRQIERQLEKEREEQERQIKEEQQLREEKEKEAEKSKVEIISTDFSSFRKEFESLTDLQQNELWSMIRGEYVQWSGRVHDVDKNTIKLKLRDYHFGGYDFEVIVADEQKDLLLSVQKDRIITVQGKLHRRSNLIFPWTLSEAVIVNY